VFYKKLVRPILFTLFKNDAEQTHAASIAALRIAGTRLVRQILSSLTAVENPRQVFGIRFPNPVGVAAGFDKHAEALAGVEALGFGFAEVGTVTPLPQLGNPRPRLFRLAEDEAIINRMGFNNEGKEAIAERLRTRPRISIPLGVNIGKGKDTTLEDAARDYQALVETFYPLADYLTINASSPNTKDLRRLQEKKRLESLLRAVGETVRACARNTSPKPILLKIAPDLSEPELDDIFEVAERSVQGLIIANTTIARPETLRSKHRAETGGLSGKPLRERARALIAYAHRKLPSMPLIGAGGIACPDDALHMFDAGASLIQIYTGLIYEGPLLAYRINKILKGNHA